MAYSGAFEATLTLVLLDAEPEDVKMRVNFRDVTSTAEEIAESMFEGVADFLRL